MLLYFLNVIKSKKIFWPYSSLCLMKVAALILWIVFEKENVIVLHGLF